MLMNPAATDSLPRYRRDAFLSINDASFSLKTNPLNARFPFHAYQKDGKKRGSKTKQSLRSFH